MRPGAIVKFENSEARLIWTNPVNNTAGIFILKNSGSIFTVANIDQLTLLEENTAFKSLSEMSTDELAARMKMKLTSAKSKKEKVNKVGADLLAALENMTPEQMEKIESILGS